MIKYILILLLSTVLISCKSNEKAAGEAQDKTGILITDEFEKKPKDPNNTFDQQENVPEESSVPHEGNNDKTKVELLTSEKQHTVNSSIPITAPTLESSDPFINPFGVGSGSSGSGDGVGDEGPYGSSQIHSSTNRKRLNDPVFDGIVSEELATIHLILTVDDKGNVVNATCNQVKTTTSNQILINRVISEVKRQVKYNVDPGAPLTKVSFVIMISPD